MAAKKTAAKKTAAKKTTTSTSAPKKTSAEKEAEALTALAEDVTNNPRKWGTGRDRDIALRAAGHDPAAVQRERIRLLRQNT